MTVSTPSDRDADADREHCDTCGEETRHEVTLDLRVESDDPDEKEAKYSREPYRVATCAACGTESALRMNDR